MVEKVSQRRITNSKDLRKLRAILPDRSHESISSARRATSFGDAAPRAGGKRRRAALPATWTLLLKR